DHLVQLRVADPRVVPRAAGAVDREEGRVDTRIAAPGAVGDLKIAVREDARAVVRIVHRQRFGAYVGLGQLGDDQFGGGNVIRRLIQEGERDVEAIFQAGCFEQTAGAVEVALVELLDLGVRQGPVQLGDGQARRLPTQPPDGLDDRV